MAFVAKGGFWPALFTTWVGGAMGFCGNMILPFITGGLFGHFLNITGASDKLGEWLVAKLGKRMSIYCIPILCVVLVYCGVMSYVFVVAYIGFGILKNANLPRQVGLAMMGGYAAISITCLPGSAFVVNLVPTVFLGTNLYAGPVIGAVCAAIAFVTITIYVERLVRACRRDGIGWNPVPGMDETPRSADELPRIGVVFAALAIVIGGGLFLILGLHLDSQHSLFATQIAATVFLLLTCRKHIVAKDGVYVEFYRGSAFALPPLIASSSVVGFASVVTLTPVYDSLLNILKNADMNPYVMTFIGVTLLCAICADSIGGLSAFMALLSPAILASGADPGAVHRVATITSCSFDSLPHNGNIAISLQVWGLSHREGYKHLFYVQTLIPFGFAAVACLLAVVMN
jgi:H+/gluconate symporter-like permease